MSGTPFFFYVPDSATIRALPERAEDFFPWMLDRIARAPMKGGDGRPIPYAGAYVWTISSYLNLREAGCNVAIVDKLPSEGIILAHTDIWTKSNKASRDQFFVEIKPDRWPKLRPADYLIAQSPTDPAFKGWYGWTGRVAFVQHWPQGGIIPRNPERGDLIENACFLGNPENFLPPEDIAQLEQKLAKLGVKFFVPDQSKWNDYSILDVIVAVRPLEYFRRSWVRPHRDPRILLKAALKLTNAWIGGSPAVLTPEPAFEWLRRSPYDYIAASSVEDVVAAVAKLKQDPNFYRAMLDNARARAPDFRVGPIAASWIDLLNGKIAAAYAEKRARRRR